VNGAAQFALPPYWALAAVHVTVTAETGTKGQLVKLEPEAWTVRLQFPVLKSKFSQVIEAEALPGTEGAVDGFVPVKLMVAGLTLRVKVPLALLCSPPGFGSPGRDATPPAPGMGSAGRTMGGVTAGRSARKNSQAFMILKRR
jgi:hypothetical protein